MRLINLFREVYILFLQVNFIDVNYRIKHDTVDFMIYSVFCLSSAKINFTRSFSS